MKLFIRICVSTHSRLKAAGRSGGTTTVRDSVSTHSRLKAAEKILTGTVHGKRFNTQPPEGGWSIVIPFYFTK